MKEVKLINKEARIIRAIELVNGNLKGIQDVLSTIEEVGTVDLALICRFEKGFMLHELYAQRAEEYIDSMTPKPLENMAQMVRDDHRRRIPGDHSIHEQVSQMKGLFSHFTYEVGEDPEITKKGNYYAISDKQERRLLEGCKVKPTKLQSEYIGYLDGLTAAKEAVRAFEEKNSVPAAIGARYMLNPACMESLLDSVK